MTPDEELDAHGNRVRVQLHQVAAIEAQLGNISSVLDTMALAQVEQDVLLDDAIALAEAMLASADASVLFPGQDTELVLNIHAELHCEPDAQPGAIAPLSLIDGILISADTSDEEYEAQLIAYAARNRIDLKEDPFANLMTPSQRVAFEKMVLEDFSLKAADCDKYDYMLAGACGVIGGLVDVLFVGAASATGGKDASPLGNAADSFVDGAVRQFARLMGWKGPAEGSDPTRSAIGWLERTFGINYDHRHGGDVGGLFKMSTRNHHIKSLGHSPDLVGLFFSILDQFCSTAHFVADGKLVSVDTETFELKGRTLSAKIFAGFVNWIGHLFSDVAGSSGAQGRGSGIPMPFYSLLQFVNVGSFGKDRQTFATIAVRVFEQGYDFRHGLAMAIPVMLTEVLTRITWVVKQWAVHNRPLSQCMPFGSIPELRRMLLVSHGSLCLVDVGDAALRSGGDIIGFLLRGNMVAWVRFGCVSLTETKALIAAGSLDHDAVDEYLDAEYARLLRA
ncbi:hypothetical protein [Stenotrophomonas sp. ZAC14D2_NAIMI4_6]|uniref:hypothetical protein n=1 Tax=Stenotrophomonas sp. ZAC14D2_NAIMI4_6 TaxID=2072406 RepID=UPI000D542725|nr:hypothetical protein [Stenotrophomonas sp. ZAC14D2_NAIMI4_6]AWH20114.1 hypothetical protein C1933_02050 [Stenotrophomonas sp. ZAC14D2_NAIMI4_6]